MMQTIRFITFAMIGFLFLYPQEINAGENQKLKAFAVGISSKSMQFREALQPAGSSTGILWNSWGITLSRENYRINPDAIFSVGLYTGSRLEVVLPRQLKFVPEEGMFIAPMVGWDVVQLGIAVGTNIFGQVNVVGQLGAGATTLFGMTHFNQIETNYSWLGYGITPNAGVRLFLSERLSLGLATRLGKVNTISFVNAKNTDLKTKSDMTTFYLTISI